MTITPITPSPTVDEVRWVAVHGSPRARVGAYLADVIPMSGDTIGENFGTRYGIRTFDPHDDSLSYETDGYLAGLCIAAAVVSDPNQRADDQCLAAFWAEILLYRTESHPTHMAQVEHAAQVERDLAASQAEAAAAADAQ